MDLNLIKYFLRVYDTGSITAAAKLVGISQPAMSAAIQRFEESVGESLFTRRGSKIEANNRAHILAEKLGGIEQQLQSALATQREIVVLAPEMLVIEMPKIEGVRMVASPFREYAALDFLRTNVVDIVIDDVRLKDHLLGKTFMSEPLYESKLVVIGTHEVLKNDTITMAEFMDFNHITLRVNQNGTTIVELLSGKKLNRKVTKEVDTTAAQILAVSYGDSICVSYEHHPLIERLGLKTLDVPFEMPNLQLEMIYMRKNYADPVHKRVRHQIKKHSKKHISTKTS